MSRAKKGISDYIKLCTSQIIFFEYGYPHFKTQTTIWNEKKTKKLFVAFPG